MQTEDKLTEAEQLVGIYTNDELNNEQYHNSPGVSNSGLTDISKCPAVYQWRKNAPQHEDKLNALNMGTALHTGLLEPHLFKEQFAIEPVLDRRTKEGKAKAKEFSEENKGKIVISAADGDKLMLMIESAMAHPAARYLLEDEGPRESSIFWIDEETGELCRIRPDKMIDNKPIIVDVKKTADINRFSKSIEDFRYHVQAGMYSDGYRQHFGEWPTFVFLVVSETIDCGRYPVRVFVLDDEAFNAGYNTYRTDLNTYHYCNTNNSWGGFEVIGRPAWAKS